MLIPLILLAFAGGAATAAYQLSPAKRAFREAKKVWDERLAPWRRVRDTGEFLDHELKRNAEQYRGDWRASIRRETDVEELRDFVEGGRVPWSSLRTADIQSIADLEEVGRERLTKIDGIGPQSAKKLDEALSQFREDLSQRTPPLPEEELERTNGRELVRNARQVMNWREAAAPIKARSQSLEEQSRNDLDRKYDRARLREWINPFADRDESKPKNIEGADAPIIDLEALSQEIIDAERQLGEEQTAHHERDELARDYRERRADYVAILEPFLGGVASRDSREFLTPEVLDRIDALKLDLNGMNVTLRGYQDFGAKFIVAQGRTLIGDEMGLGKTMQALAAMTHLRNAEGKNRFFVVCPSSLVENWRREIVKRTDFDPVVLRGEDRAVATAHWIENGGLAITSLETLRSGDILAALRDAGTILDLVISDEAHCVKNPEAQRTMAFREAADRAQAVCLMTGTPIENELGDFGNIVAHLGEGLPHRIALQLTSAKRARLPREDFMHLVAPIYLRRNQEDVLTELPEKIEVAEWVELGSNDLFAYQAAVRERDFMGMRRAASIGLVGSLHSAKLDRLNELVEDYRLEGRKMILFSFFLDVLDAVKNRIPDVELISGKVPAGQRQELMDAFSNSEGFGMLAFQIGVGGVGLNLQAASVVVLLEPQWKPSTESQAIARAHRMGQSRAVVVHRLLAKDSVDERMVEVLSEKQATFDDYVRESALADAVDSATESQLVAEIIEAEVARIDGPSESKA